MKVFFGPRPDGGGSLRDALLRESLLTYVTRMAPSTYPEVEDIGDEETGLGPISAVGLLPPARGAKKSLFVGLANAPARMLERNLLVLTRALDAELRDFGRRNGLADPRGDLRTKEALRAFDAAILIERTAAAGAVGFAPWLPLRLADRFPVMLGRVGALDKPARTLLIDHGHGRASLRAELDATARTAGPLSVIAAADGPTAANAEALTADVHIHFGFSNHAAPVALTPLDSMMNGAYTLIVPREPQGPHSAGQAIQREAESRSYVAIADTAAAARRVLEAFLGRVGAVHRQKLSFNPEIRRFEQINERYVAQCLRRFEDQVAA